MALHGVSRAGPLLGKRVLVSGCGPIGALTVAAARVHGAAEITALPQTMAVGKDLSICRSFRFHAEFDLAVRLINAGRVDIGPMITGAVPLAQAREAFELASDRKKAMKVLLDFSAETRRAAWRAGLRSG